MTPTLKDIARLANIDPGAVSRTLRNHPKALELRPETRERIRKIANELGYQRNLLASSTRTGIVHTIAVVGRFADMEIWSSEAQVLAGILKESSKHDYSVKVYADENLEQAFQEIRGNRIQNVISISVEGGKRLKTVELCKEYHLKLVYIYEHTHEEFSAITIDNKLAAAMAVESLISRGHRRIGLLCAPHQFHYVRERHAGYLKALQDAGIEPDAAWTACSDETAENVTRMLELPPERRPTAVFAIADNLAVIAQNTALRLGFRVPEDLSTFGFGNSKANEWAYSPLSSVEESFGRRGELAVEYLLGNPIGLSKDASGTYLVPPILVDRNSVAILNLRVEKEGKP